MKYLVVIFSFFLLNSCISYAEIPTQETYKTHKVEKGETIYSIAKKYNITEEAIYRLNPDAKHSLSTNSLLIIPSSSAPEQIVTEYKSHKVKRKETIFGIAQKYGITVDDIKKYNKFLYSRGLKKGDDLMIPQFEKGVISETSSETTNETTITTKDTRIHEVQPKETFYGIARKYGVSVAELKALNPEIKEGLPVGTKLNVPNTSVTEEATIDERFDFYEVQPKEGFYRLKVKLGLSEEEIVALNPYAKDGLKEGMILKIPKEISETISIETNKVNLEDNIVNVETKRLAVLLPFQLREVERDSVDSQKDILKKNRTLRIALDFYSGVLMATEFAKDKGISVDLMVYDSEGSNDALSKILSQHDFSNIDAVIGPLLSKNVEFVAQELKNDAIPVFSPLSNRSIKLTSNLFQTLPDEELLTKQMIQYLKEHSVGKKLILIADKDSKTKGEILSAIPATTLISPREKGFLYVGDIEGKMDKSLENWVILESTNPVLISNVIGLLNGLNSTRKIRLFTTNKNDNFEYDDISNVHLANLSFTFPSVSKSYDFDEKNPFLVSYKNKYGVLPNRYAVRGFDLTYDVLLRLASAKNVYDATDSDSETEYVENKFRYDKKLFSGYSNQAFYILKYGENLQMEEVKQ
ncbi:MAG: LysM peptidoglycan-binding domain-containing protein [Flavobacteriaceae bacterium]